MKRIKVSQAGMIAALAQGVLLLACGARGLTVGIEELGDEDSSDTQTPSPGNAEPQVPQGPTVAEPQVPQGPTVAEPQNPTPEPPNVPLGPSQDGGVHKYLCLENAGITTCYAPCETDENCPERTECIPIAVDAAFCLPADDTFTPSGPSSPGAESL